jgi:hypothetical protein
VHCEDKEEIGYLRGGGGGGGGGGRRRRNTGRNLWVDPLIFYFIRSLRFISLPFKTKKEKTSKRCMRVEEPKRRIKEEIVTREKNLSSNSNSFLIRRTLEG